MVVIDEASMLDLVLANNLLKAISPDSHLLLVGDVDQLPSVGAGDVLRDLIDSGVAAVIRLETIFRVLFQQAVDDTDQPLGDVGIDFTDRPRCVVADAMQYAHRRVSTEGGTSGTHCVHDGTKTEQIRPLIG